MSEDIGCTLRLSWEFSDGVERDPKEMSDDERGQCLLIGVLTLANECGVGIEYVSMIAGTATAQHMLGMRQALHDLRKKPQVEVASVADLAAANRLAKLNGQG